MSWKVFVGFSPNLQQWCTYYGTEMSGLNFGVKRVTAQGYGGVTYAGTITVQAEAYSTWHFVLSWDFLVVWYWGLSGMFWHRGVSVKAVQVRLRPALQWQSLRLVSQSVQLQTIWSRFPRGEKDFVGWNTLESTSTEWTKSLRPLCPLIEPRVATYDRNVREFLMLV